MSVYEGLHLFVKQNFLKTTTGKKSCAKMETICSKSINASLFCLNSKKLKITKPLQHAAF